MTNDYYGVGPRGGGSGLRGGLGGKGGKGNNLFSDAINKSRKSGGKSVPL